MGVPRPTALHALRLNERVRAEEGTDGTIVVIAAWCETCNAESMPTERGECSFCGTQIVDFDTLKVKELREAMRREPLAPVIPLRGDEPLQLRLSDGFSLPIDVAGEAIAILAKRGAGKTNTGRVLAEELHAAGVPIIVLDPVGVWWGLRSSADGRHDGLPIPIVGGAHGDVELKPWGGEAAAQSVVETGGSLILDLSEFPRDAQREFVADFATELYALKRESQELLHVLLEEADEFAPQASRGGVSREETSRMRGAIETLARRGRSRGIGLTMITQRSAALSKDVLTQADVLLALRTTGPTDIRAIEAWVSHHGDAGDEVVASLSSLKTGEAWVWNPERDVLARVQIRLASTFDSSATPKFGERRADPEHVAAVTLPFAIAEPVGGEQADPEPDVDDYRRQDDEGRWGCKIEGCDGRSSSRAGPYAYLCDDTHAPQARESPPRSPRSLPDRWRLDDEPPPEPGPLDEPLGVSGNFGRDAERARREAARLRKQAEALDVIARGLEALEETRDA